MGQKLVVGPFNRGLRNDVTPFNIDNDSFPTLINAYQWRGRIKRKRGTTQLGRLRRYVGATDGSGNASITLYPIPETGLSQYVCGTDIFQDTGSATVPAPLLSNSSATATLNRSTGVLTITGSNATTGIYQYPGLPVLGLEDLVLPTRS